MIWIKELQIPMRQDVHAATTFSCMGDDMMRGTARVPANAAAPHAFGCALCSLKSGCLARDLTANDLDAFSGIVRLKRKISHSGPLFCAGDPLSAIYVVRSGTFKTVSVSREGHSKITGFYLPGDVLGLHAIAEGRYAFDAIALEDSEVCVLPLQQLESMACAVPALQRQFTRALSRAISVDHRMLLFGCMDAEQRVARLLLSLADRYHHLGYSGDALLLHMTRDDIASYLCLSSETVSRIFSRLQRKGVLTVHQRHIEFVDPGQLAEVSAW
jgi:CRP/FNR family transcriptional regulator